MKEGNFVPKDTSFDALVGGLGLEVLRPSPRPVLYLLPAPRPLLSPEGALLLFRPQEGLYRYRNAAGFLLPEPDPELLAFAEREGLGFALYPPWLKRESLERALALRLFALAPGMALAGLLDLFLKLPERALLEVLHQATGLALAHVAPWGEVLGFAGPVPARHPKEPGTGRGWAQRRRSGRGGWWRSWRRRRGWCGRCTRAGWRRRGA